jgi:hypothetical protein
LGRPLLSLASASLKARSLQSQQRPAMTGWFASPLSKFEFLTFDEDLDRYQRVARGAIVEKLAEATIAQIAKKKQILFFAFYSLSSGRGCTGGPGVPQLLPGVDRFLHRGSRRFGGFGWACDGGDFSKHRPDSAISPSSFAGGGHDWQAHFDFAFEHGRADAATAMGTGAGDRHVCRSGRVARGEVDRARNSRTDGVRAAALRIEVGVGVGGSAGASLFAGSDFAFNRAWLWLLLRWRWCDCDFYCFDAECLGVVGRNSAVTEQSRKVDPSLRSR